MITRFTLLAGVCLFCCTLPSRADAQVVDPATTTQAQQNLLRVFVDCYECDTEYLRQNVLFVDYVRDRTVADVHLLVTTEGTGRRREGMDAEVHRTGTLRQDRSNSDVHHAPNGHE